MQTDRIAAVRKIVGDQKLDVLSDIFQRSAGAPPGVRADRYKADRHEWFEILNRLEVEQLFLHRQQRDAGNYQVRVYALLRHEDRRHPRCRGTEDWYRC